MCNNILKPFYVDIRTAAAVLLVVLVYLLYDVVLAILFKIMKMIQNEMITELDNDARTSI